VAGFSFAAVAKEVFPHQCADLFNETRRAQVALELGDRGLSAPTLADLEGVPPRRLRNPTSTPADIHRVGFKELSPCKLVKLFSGDPPPLRALEIDISTLLDVILDLNFYGPLLLLPFVPPFARGLADEGETNA
jgi:hypothetical protein